MILIIGGRPARASLSAGKEFVKNVKAYKSALTAIFVRVTLRLVKLPRPSGPTLLTGALLVLLPALAVLQYRWVGQVSDAERERMQRNLRNAALQFREAFDVEVGRAVLSLQVGPATARDGASEQYTDRYETWVDTSEHPRLVSDIFLVDADGARRCACGGWNPEPHVFEPAAWPEALAALAAGLRARSCATSTPASRSTGASRSPTRSRWSSPAPQPVGPGRGPASRTASITPVFGFTVLQLDMRYMREEMLPALARRHFIASGRRQLSRGGGLGERSVAGAVSLGSRRARRPGRAPTPAKSFFGRAARRAALLRPRRRRRGRRRLGAAAGPASTSGGWRRRSAAARRGARAAGGCSCSTRAARSRPRWRARGGATSPSASACCCCSASASRC